MRHVIETLIAREDWKAARRELRNLLRKNSDSHWGWTRLSLTYYEQHDYEKALECSEKAMALDPECPLVLWDYAGTLDMLGRRPTPAVPERIRQAIAVYRKLIQRGEDRIAEGNVRGDRVYCGEGKVWARSLIADCWYRLALAYRTLGQRKKALGCINECLAIRTRRVKFNSPYCLADIRRFRVDE